MARARSAAGSPGARSAAPAQRAAPNPWLDLSGNGRHLHIGHFLTFQIIRLANAAKANVTRRYLHEFKLSVPEWRLLAMTFRFEPVRFSELVAKSHMDKGQASRTLQELTRRGLINTRDPSGRARRSADPSSPVILSLTTRGRRLYQTVLPVAQRNQAELLKVLTREERKVLYGVLHKLFAAVGDSDELA